MGGQEVTSVDILLVLEQDLGKVLSTSSKGLVGQNLGLEIPNNPVIFT